MSNGDYVSQSKATIHGPELRLINLEVIHRSMDGLTYLLCPSGVSGYFLHPFDCTKYIECKHDGTFVNSCANGAVFSISHKQCLPRDRVVAFDRVEYLTTTNNEFTTSDSKQQNNQHVGSTCSPGIFGLYPFRNDRQQYIRCSDGRMLLERCPGGQVFSRTQHICHYENEMATSDRGVYNRGLTAPQGTNTVYSTSSLNSGYSPQTAFNPLSPQDTNPPSTGLKPPLPTPINGAVTSNVVCPSGATGRYPHPFDCTKFLMCANGKTHIQDCGPGTAWNKDMEVCDFKEKVSCSASDATSNNRDSKQYNNGWPIANPSQNPPTTQVTGNRWINMDKPRPQGTTYDQSTTWQQSVNSHERKPVGSTSAWPGSAVHVDQHNPAHTLVHEEGPSEPNRNYNRRMYNTPLAPLKPTPATTTASTIVYAQPVDSQEDSKEIFSPAGPKPSNAHNPQYFPTSHRQNQTRPINQLIPIRPVDITRHQSNPSYTSAFYPTPTLQGSQPSWPANRPQGQYPAPRLNPPYGHEDSGQKPLLESEFKFDPIPGQLTYDLNDFDPLRASSPKHNINSNLQPPLDQTLATTTVSSFSPPPYEQTTQLAPPLEPTTPIHRARDYPQLSNATIQTFPHQPHYSPPYAEVAHSRNISWVGRKIPQYSAIKPTHRDPLNYGKGNGKKTITSTPQYPGLDAPTYSNNENERAETTLDDQEAAMKAALKLLLKPYLDSDSKVDNNIAEKAQSHIMNLVANSDKVSTTTTPTPHTTFLNKNTLVPSTTPHQEDVELILAGEQHNLVGVITTHAGNHAPSTSYNSYHTPLASTRSTYSHDHNTNWHNRHNNHNSHNAKWQHSREFHKKHPNLPNPFDDSVATYNPQAEGTTQRTYDDFDLRTGGRCPFHCGNEHCIELHQICDGVDNCGNRRDEQECEQLGYEVRLTGGESSNMGRVEVKILGRWGYVCDDKFGLPDADVVCRELGFKMGALEVRGNSYYAPTDVNIHFAMDEVACRGNETSLRECDFKGWGASNCGPDEVVGVVCKVPKLKCPDNYWLCSTSKECIPTAFLCDVTPDCADGSDESEEVCNAPIQYRLEGGRSSNEGRLEVFYRGEWGTVCDDDFGLKEAQVACYSFGLYGKSQIVKNIYGPGSGPIWLDQVSCLGNETQIDECNHWSWGENNCNHTEDVGIKCIAGPKPSTSKTHNPSKTDDASSQDLDLESTLQFEQSELDDLGLYQGLWQRSSKAIHTQKKCGHFKSNLIDEYEHPEERVINGTIAKRGRHPWQATIRTRGRGGISSHWCGAVIISRKLILTAAHCLAGYPKGSYFVRMGDHYANIAESSEIDSNIENWYIHEKFRDKKHMNNDIALILLKTPVHFNDYVQPVCLPEKGTALENNRMCTISGWGSIKSGTSTPSNILRSAQVPILADDVCSQKNVYANAMTEGMFCAGFLDESADACDGDSGGPLVCSDEDGETLYGIISWGQHCGYANHPGVYVRVEKYIDWIYEKINLMLQQGRL